MASMMFERVIPSGKDAYFPLQFSSTGLTLTANVYEVNDATSGSAHSTVTSSTVELAGGLYALKVAAGNMTAGKMYYATVSAGQEVVRVQAWAYAPQDHIGDALSAMGATGAGGLFNDSTNLYAEIQEVQTEIGDVSAAGIAGSPASVAAALKIVFDEAQAAATDAGSNKTKIGTNADAASLSGSLFAAIKQVAAETDDIDTALGNMQTEIGDISAASYTGITSPATVSAALAEIHNRIVTDTGAIDSTLSTMDGKLNTISGNVDDIEGMLGALGDSAAADYGTDKKLMAMVRKLGADVADVYAKVDTEVDAIVTAVGAASDLAATNYSSGSLHAKVRKLGDDLSTAKGVIDETNSYLEDGTNGLAAIKSAVAGVQNDLDNGTDGLGAIKTAVTDNYDRLGAPAGASVSADIAAVKALADNLTHGTHGLSALDSDLGTLISELGDNADVSSDATVFGKIAAMAAKVDALQTGVNARLIPSAPELIYAGSTDTYVRIAVQVRDGVTGQLEEPDTETGGTSGNGHVAVKVYENGSEITASGNNRVYEDSGSTALATATASGSSGLFDGWHLMKRVSTGVFEIFLKVPAGHNGVVQFDFQCADSDPSSTRAFFYATRNLTLRNAVAPLGQFGSF
jgi:hypothetical protein